jgi:alpha-tubulin suppressor-like RCC1 family protein
MTRKIKSGFRWLLWTKGGVAICFMLMFLGGYLALRAQSSGLVALPSVYPQGGMFAGPQKIQVSCSTAGVELHYTKNGNEPTTADPFILSGQTIRIDQTGTLKVKAFGSLGSSATRVMGYRITGGISMGAYHSLAVKYDGTVRTWGRNSEYQLGDGSNVEKLSPFLIPNFNEVSDVGGLKYHTLVLKTDGSIWSWGADWMGMLGRDGVEGLPGQVAISDAVKLGKGATAYHSLVTLKNGELWAWGWNYYNQLGDGTYSDRYYPVKIGFNDCIDLSLGSSHSAALNSDGNVWSWGSNIYAQLGNGTGNGSALPVQTLGIADVVSVICADAATLVLKSDGTVWMWGQHAWGWQNLYPVPTKVVGLDNIIAIAAGNYHYLALKSDGTVWAWGTNYFGELGLGVADPLGSPSRTPAKITSLSRIVAISAGEYHSTALRYDGTVWTWGYNSGGAIGDGTKIDRYSPIKISNLVLIKVNEDSDGDFLHDPWEIKFFGGKTQTALTDFDNDGLSNLDEFYEGTNPTLADSDFDGVPDGQEILMGLDPQNPDSNGNGLIDGEEDFDGDGVSNSKEARQGRNPMKPEISGDGIINFNVYTPLK